MGSELFSSISSLKALNLGFIRFESPEWFFIAIPLIILMFVLITINFVKFSKEIRGRLWKLRLFVIATRILIILLIACALATPFITKKLVTDGDPGIALLVDDSKSMDLFDVDIKELEKNLKKHVPVTKSFIGHEETSRLGDGIFRQLHRRNLLVVTDANNDKESMNFFDVVGYAQKFNTSINAVKLGEEKPDASIAIEGPKTSITGTEYHFNVKIHNADGPVNVRVVIGGKTVFEGETEERSIGLSQTFSGVGHKKITAQLLEEDHFPENNVFYKVVEIAEKPKVLYLSNRDSKIGNLLSARYSVTTGDSFPGDLSSYFAVILNDNMNTVTVDEEKDLESYTDDGNGLVVWGGQNSFKGPSNIDVLLPVQQGEVDESGSDFNFIFVVDMSGVIDNALMETELYALDIMNQLKERKESINVAVVDFSYMAHVMSDFKPISEISQIEQDITNFRDVSKIDGTYWLRPADLASGLKMARETFVGKPGNNNIIVVSDGNIHYEKYFTKAEKELEELRNEDIRVHSVHLEAAGLDDSVLRRVRRKISSLGRGTYIASVQAINDLFEKKLVVSDSEHFISNELLLSASVTNFNKVKPTPSARTLITTGTGAPIVTVNSYNKVAAVTTDDGKEWAPTMFQNENLALFYRIFDWAVGDPNRKKAQYTNIPDTTIGKETKIKYKGPQKPNTERCAFLEIDDHYECTFSSAQVGFDEILNTPFAVNYDDEYKEVGYNEGKLKFLTQETAGLIFNAEKIEQIVDKVKKDAKIETLKRIKIDWWFIGLAIMLFLFEVFVRRIIQNKGSLRE